MGDDDLTIPSSALEVLPTVHLAERCAERDISPVELIAAIKYGTRTEGEVRNDQRAWLFSYGGITYVTDYLMQRGITSWVEPCWGFDVEKVPISKEMEDSHNEALKRALDHSTWNSHAVIVVDQSGSMRKTDATKGVTRSDLVWLCLAVDYVGKRLRTGEATSRDYVSLVELGGNYDCVLREQPLDWILYNRIVDIVRSHCPRGEGNYLPAIKKAQELLSLNKSGKCALQLVFLTDGIPSDFSCQERCKYASCNQIASLACRFGSRLTVGGFAVGVEQYATLNAMVKTAEEYNCKGFLMEASLRVEDLSSAFHSMSTLMTETKTTMTDFKTNSHRTYRDLIREPSSSVSIYLEDESEWKYYTNVPGCDPSVERTYFDRKEYCWKYPESTFESLGAVGIAVRDFVFGEGRERAVRRVREVNRAGFFVGAPLVGKETLFQEDLDPDDVRAFHKNFCKLQQLAQKYATIFNRKLSSLPGARTKVPRIHFLECWVMMFVNEKNEQDAILVEKMLDVKSYTKWNTNAGYVKGSPSPTATRSLEIGDGVCISIEDVPQAFSHFTYIASGRRFLVCDLQGVLNTSLSPPVFELTDPAIHYKKRTQRIDFGRTDRGEAGIQDFLTSHKCSPLCRMLCRRWLDDPIENEVIQLRDIREVPTVGQKTHKRVRFAE
ncbi:hypothetical protein ACHAWF_005537 [Thalassiosira exigua]